MDKEIQIKALDQEILSCFSTGVWLNNEKWMYSKLWVMLPTFLADEEYIPIATEDNYIISIG